MNPSLRPSKRNPVSWPLVGLLILTLAVFHKVLFFGETYFVGDILCHYYPIRFYIQKWLAQGVLPLWSSQIFNGFPLLASAQTGIYNPFERIIFTFFPVVFAYNLNLAVHYFIGAVSMYALVKHLTNDKETAFLSAISFVFSGFFFVYLTYITVLSLCYLPLIVLLAYRCFTQNKLLHVWLLAIVLGIQLFASSAQYTFYTLITITLLAGFLVIKPLRKTSNRFAPIVLLMLAVLGFLLFAAVQIIPTIELAGHSVRRSGVEETVWKTASFPPRHLVTLLIPHYWGEMYRFGVYQGEWNFLDLNCYMGIVPLLLAALPLFLKRRPAISNFFYFLMGVALFLAFGKFNPFYKFFYHLPLFKSFRYPGRILVLLVFSLAINAGFGFSAVASRTEPQRLKRALYVLTALWLILAVAIFTHIQQTGGDLYNIRLTGFYKMNLYFILGLLPLYWQVFKGMNRRLFFSWLVTVVLIDNMLFGYPFNPTIRREMLDFKPAVWDKLEARGDKYRVYVQRTLPFFAVQRGELIKNSDISRLVKTNIELLQGNIALLTPFYAYHGYDPLELNLYYLVNINLGLYQLTGERQFNLFLGRSGARYLLRWNEQPLKKQKPFVVGDSSLIYEQAQALPRAYFAKGYQVITDPSFALKYLNNPVFNPENQVLLAEKPPAPPPKTGMTSTNKKAEISLQDNGPNEVLLDVDAPTAGWLVLNDSYYPGWQVTVDGVETEIYRANLLFRAIQIAPGKHTVLFRYRPKSWLYGAIISILTLVGLTTTIVYFALKERA